MYNVNKLYYYPITTTNLLELVNALLKCQGLLLLNFNIPQICRSISPSDTQKWESRNGKRLGQGDKNAYFSF